eukprot:CAMPEP_0204832364 /NCGR_PEP_ID=MMETSP1346-20131115/13406_1 /ASSEMBLY_ACC=CAM_ASM_000771 /TAXON_ID=215587 /ORGANISM="Aplanochytrium stocchinoi, Strain GSBS06" /LENGTH=202 /DNA_ID=CAMNT_0051964127 /DNA_START=154 /DNA_END=762 /DNA_ORIENTATION=-
MGSLKFYYSPESSSLMTETCLNELDIPFEKIKIDVKKKETQTEEYLKINPNGLVPAIDHDGTILWESAAIDMYLGETFGVEKNLYPPPGKLRGQAMKWIVWSNVTFGEAIGRYFHGDSKEIAEKAMTDISKCLKILDDRLKENPSLLDDFEYSLVDTHVAVIVAWLSLIKVDIEPYEGLWKWYMKISERPAFTKAMKPSGET